MSVFLTKVLVNLDGIWYTVKACWCDKRHTHLSSPFSIRERTLLMRFCDINFNIDMDSDIYRMISFKFGMMMDP